MIVSKDDVVSCYLENKEKKQCFGCGACEQACPKKAITMVEDKEGFRYPVVDKDKCVNCNICHKVCPYINKADKYEFKQYVFGGYYKDWNVRDKSTSGGAFTAIVETFCDDNYVIFGATSKGLMVYHTYIENKNDIDLFRKSKYLQSEIGNSYNDVKKFLKQGKKVLFSGTPCQIAGLRTFLGKQDISNLLTVEVICEGVPSPHYIKKLDNHFRDKYNSEILNVDYRYKNVKKVQKFIYGKWDFQVMNILLKNKKQLKRDRWLNPFWQLWLNHLMSRPSCYECPFTTSNRVADVTLGDLWGVHLYCPELYGNNGGSSLVICNTQKGKNVFKKAQKLMFGHELKLEEALKYQSPLRKPISCNSQRSEFIDDLINDDINYKKLIKKWYKFPSIKLLYSKYIWGNRQKVFFWRVRKGVKND